MFVPDPLSGSDDADNSGGAGAETSDHLAALWIRSLSQRRNTVRGQCK